MVGYDSKKKSLTEREIFLASSTSAFLSRFVFQPIDVIKIRLQLQIEPIRFAQQSKYKSLIQTVALIHREETIRAFWKGHLAAQILSITFTAVQVRHEKPSKQL